MATFVLVHGGGHGGWCYKRVAQILKQTGHDVYCPSLTGLAEHKHLLGPEIDLNTHITDIVNFLEYNELQDVILVGHSYGGMVITGVADRASACIAHIVYLDAAHPKHGESLADVSPVAMQVLKGELETINGVALVMLPGSAAISYLGIDDPDDFEWVASKVTPHPWRCFTTPLVLENEALLKKIPTTNINCTQSLASSSDEARARQLSGDFLFEINTGHDLMITEPKKVADMFLETVNRS